MAPGGFFEQSGSFLRKDGTLIDGASIVVCCFFYRFMLSFYRFMLFYYRFMLFYYRFMLFSIVVCCFSIVVCCFCHRHSLEHRHLGQVCGESAMAVSASRNL